jgi:hypothetical protein
LPAAVTRHDATARAALLMPNIDQTGVIAESLNAYITRLTDT